MAHQSRPAIAIDTLKSLYKSHSNAYPSLKRGTNISPPNRGQSPIVAVNNSNAPRLLVGIAAITAPILHTTTDVVELLQGGFSTPMLWANDIAFLPMPWLLLGIDATHPVKISPLALVGAVLYGVASARMVAYER